MSCQDYNCYTHSKHYWKLISYLPTAMLLYYLLSCMIIIIPSVRSTLPITASSVKIDQCSSTINSTIKYNVRNTLPAVNDQLDMKYGPPCACGYSWTKVVHLDMSDPQQQCPSNWSLYNTNNVRGCGRKSTGNRIADSVTYSTNGRQYSRVCGRVLAYQRGITDAFFPFARLGQTTIESSYLDGVSLTYGPPGSRKHIWSFVAAIFEGVIRGGDNSAQCPCMSTSFNPSDFPQNIIGNNYFCDTGDKNQDPVAGRIYSNDPLWDGSGCGPTSSCCEFRHPPWFCVRLPEETNEDLELRIFLSEVFSDEDVVVSNIDIYVQ